MLREASNQAEFGLDYIFRLMSMVHEILTRAPSALLGRDAVQRGIPAYGAGHEHGTAALFLTPHPSFTACESIAYAAAQKLVSHIMARSAWRDAPLRARRNKNDNTYAHRRSPPGGNPGGRRSGKPD
jgi:hypothetical protein